MLKISQIRTALLLAFILLSGIFLFFFNEAETRPTKKVSQLFKEYPNEWMYLQRAYPDNIINQEAMNRAVQQIRDIQKNRRVVQQGNWELEGPVNIGGRITDVAISPDSDDHLFIATAAGGVFRTTDRGTNWAPIFDVTGETSIGSIAIAPSNSQRIYVGTGEANGGAPEGAFFGNGIYRSDDGGDTWNNMGLPNSNHIGRIIVDPNDQDRVFAAVAGKLYGYNPERGIYRSTNGGTDWERVLHVTDSTAATEIVMNPANTNILFAAMWERTRKPWQRDYGGVTSAIHRSMDGGDTWEQLGSGNGLPAPDDQTGRIGLAISESNPSIIYARYTTNEITNTFDAIYKSVDNGTNWVEINSAELVNIDAFFGWYFGNIRVNPINPDEVYVLGQTLYRSTNSGDDWQQVNGMHVDHHAMEYSKNNNNFILAGNDGGAYISEDGGNNWTHFDNLPITQFYNIEVDFLQPERLYGGTQDNNTIRTLTGNNDDWVAILGGDGFHVNVDPTDNDFVYAEAQFGYLRRSVDGGFTFLYALNGIDNNDRQNWNTPVVLSPFNPEIVYYGSHRLYSSNRAVSWTAISPDLTDGEHSSGSLSYGTLTAIAASYNNLNTIYTGSDDGNVHVTFNGGTDWTDISSGLPDRYVTSIAISPDDDQTAYITFSGFRMLDYDPHVFKTVDGGQNWTDISSNLPGIPVNDIIIGAGNILFLATDINVWYSQNDGASWQVLGNGLPMTTVSDLKYHEPTNMLYAGTYGRSIYSYDLDDLVLSADQFVLNINKLHVYPNPAADKIHIDHQFLTRGTVSLYDIRGRLIKQLFEGDLQEIRNIPLALAGNETGVYFVKIESEGQNISKKILIH